MNKNSWKPTELQQELKKKIKGQDEYLKDLSTCLWMHHLRRQHFLQTGEKMQKPKYNMFIIGKSGMGKTSTIVEAAKLLDIPIVIEDASELRGSGWRGKQVCEIVRDIAEVSSFSKSKEKKLDEFAIVVLDEMDKVIGPMGDKTFSPIANLLKFVEGMDAFYADANLQLHMRTDNLLFIVAGAFDGLKEQISKRMKPKKMGFSINESTKSLDEANILKNVTTEDLVAFGVNEQFLGRFPMLCVLNELDTTEYKQILLESEISPIKQLDAFLKKECGVTISVTETAITQLAEETKNSSLGARGLQQKVATLFKDTLYCLAENPTYAGYTLDYDGTFEVRPLFGKRNFAGGKRKEIPFVLNKAQAKTIQNIKLDKISETEEEIRIYADELFEPFEIEKFGKYPNEGFVHIYDYMTIKQAKLFTAIAITNLLMEVKKGNKKKNMLSLLNVIKEMEIDPYKYDYCEGSQSALQSVEDRLLYRLECLNRGEHLEECRTFSWNIVKKYAFLISNMETNWEVSTH